MPFLALLAIAGGIAVGLWLPDIDHVFPFLRHRSVVTHSALLPFLVLLLAQQRDERWPRLAGAGLSVAVAIHLAFDLYPRNWYGTALLHWPIIIRPLGSTESILVLLGSIVACLYLALQAIRTRDELIMLVGCALVGFWVTASGERSFWQPLLLVVGAFAAVSCFPNPTVPGRRWAAQLAQRLRAARAA